MLMDSAFRHKIAFWLCALIVFLQAYNVPASPFTPGLDGSYPHVLNLSAFTSAKFGRDVVYTFGPLGFLLRAEDVGINLLVTYAFWTLIYACFGLAVSHLIVNRTRAGYLVVATAFAAVVVSFVDPDRLLTCLVMLLLFIGYDTPRYRTFLIGCCGSLAAFGLLMKMTVGVGCIGSLFASLLIPFTPLRRVLSRAVVAALAITITFCIIWRISSGSFEGVGSYFYNSLQLSEAYTATMSSSATVSSAHGNEGTSLFFFLSAMASLIVFAAMLQRWQNLHSVAVILPFLAIAWKHGVVRFDQHVAALVTVLVFSTFCVSLLHVRFKPALSAGRPGLSILGAAAILPLTALGLVESGLVEATRYSTGVLGGLQPLSNVFRFSEYRLEMRRESEARHAGYRLPNDLLLRIGDKTVDVYSYDLGFIAANPQLHWHLKPIFQHFNAFTEHLDTLNANFLAAPGKPDFLLMFHPADGSMEGVDGRHQLFDDPIAFLQIMRSYRTVFVDRDPTKPQVGLLERNENSRFSQPAVFKSEVASWDKPIAVPATDDSSIIRIRIELNKPLLSQITETMFRLNPIRIVYILADGTEKKYRLMPPHLNSGVLVEPMFENYWQLYDFLAGHDWTGSRVVAIRFESDRHDDYFAPFLISWEKIDCHTDEPCRAARQRISSHPSDSQ